MFSRRKFQKGAFAAGSAWLKEYHYMTSTRRKHHMQRRAAFLLVG